MVGLKVSLLGVICLRLGDALSDEAPTPAGTRSAWGEGHLAAGASAVSLLQVRSEQMSPTSADGGESFAKGPRAPTAPPTAMPTPYPTTPPTVPPVCTTAPLPKNPCDAIEFARTDEQFCPTLWPEDRGSQPNWGIPSHDVSAYSQYSTCTVARKTKFKTCQNFCAGYSMVCIQGSDNDHHNEQGLGAICVLAPLSRQHNQTEAQNGCQQAWKSQICECGFPPPCPTLSPTPSPTPSPTRKNGLTPCDPVSSCTIVDDPHITVFDNAQVSLLGMGRALGARSLKEDYGSGEMWLVKSRLVSIQAQYMPDETLTQKNMYVKAVAVGGPFLGNSTLLIGAMNDVVTWDGRAVLDPPSSQGTPMGIISLFEVAGLLRASQSSDGEVVAELPLNVVLTVKRKRQHVNIFIKMPSVDGGQEGLCGNFNGLAGDDSLDLVESRSDPRVEPGASLFTA